MDREQIIESLLGNLLAEAGDEAWAEAADAAGVEPFDGEGDPVKRVSSFDSDMVMTSNRGVVLDLTDGSQYQITIVRSR